MSVDIAFTGTQVGWSAKQYDAIQDHVWEISHGNPAFFRLHHGDCIGADANIHEICFEMGWHITVHPPTVADKRAFVNGTKFWDETRCTMLEPKPYLDRNHDMVDVGPLELWATPKEQVEVLRSGTWATARYARKKDLRTRFFFRDGTTGVWKPGVPPPFKRDS